MIAPQTAAPTAPAGGGMPMAPAGLNPAALAGMARPNPTMTPAAGGGVDPNLIAALAAGKGGGPAPMAPSPAPMPRKSGGRAYPITGGAGGGRARLEKEAAYGLKMPTWGKSK